MARHQRHFPPLGRGGGGSGDLRLLKRIAGRDLPLVGDVALKADLEALAALGAGEDGEVGHRIERPGVGPVEPVECDGREQAGNRLPLGADLVIVEALRLQALRGHVERAELVAGARQVGAAVAGIERQSVDRLHDQPEPGREQIVGSAEGLAGIAVEDVQLEAVVAQAGDDLEPVRDAQLLLGVESEDRGVALVEIGRRAGRIGVDRQEDEVRRRWSARRAGR